MRFDWAWRADGRAAPVVARRHGTAFPGWWRRDGVFLLTIAGTRPQRPPVRPDGIGQLADTQPVHSRLVRPLVD